MNRFYILLFFVSLGCSSSMKVKDGKTAFEYKKYNKAIGLFKKEFQSTSRQEIMAEKAYYIAESYIMINDFSQANEWYQTAEQKGYGVKALYGLAKTYKNLEKYEKAKEIYENLAFAIPTDLNLKSQVFICNQAISWINESEDNYSLQKLMPNTLYSEYSPVIYDDRYLVFTSDNEEASGSSRYDWTGNKMSDLFIIDKRGDNKVSKFDSYINSNSNDGTAVFSKDYNEMYFTRCYNTTSLGDDFCKLMFSKRQQGIWTEPVLLPFIKEGINYGQPCLIEEDSVLIFSSLSVGNANGYDLWYVEKDGDSWGVPYAMPESINTPGDEFFPSSDADTLYFSSNYLPGMGGLDIFKTFLLPDGSWKKPENVRLPYNSGGDDFGLIFDRIDKTEKGITSKGYFTSNRSAEGHEDIYYFENYIKLPTEESKTEIVKKPVKESINLYLAGKVMEFEFRIENDPNSGIKGKRPIANPNVKLNFNDSISTNINSNERGLFIGSIEYGNTYIIKVQKQGYLSNSIILNTLDYIIPEDENSYTINQEIILERIFKGQEIILDKIYYDFNESFIREDAQPTLDELAIKLINNPSISIELLSHTDCRGESDYNIALSQRRAEAAVQYLVAKGIGLTRLNAKGYGETEPVISCDCTSCTEDEHQKNRRTSFKIL